MPRFRRKDLVQGLWRVSVRVADPNRIPARITWDRIAVAKLLHCASNQRIRVLFPRIFRFAHQLAVRRVKTRSPNYSVGITPKVNEAHAIVLFLRRRNQGGGGQHQLVPVLHVIIRTHHHAVAIFVQGGAKLRISVGRRTEDDVENHQTRTGPEQFVHEMDPKLARPRRRKWMFGHQLQTAILRDLLRTDRIELNRLLVQSDENQLRVRRCLATLATQHVFETAFAAPNTGEHGKEWKKMRQHYEAGPHCRDGSQHCQSMTMKPVHGRIISQRKLECRMTNKIPNERRLSSRDSPFVIRHFPPTFRAPKHGLSTCPATAGLISERGRKEPKYKQRAERGVVK